MNILVCDDDLSIANSIAKYIKNKFKHEVFVSINRRGSECNTFRKY